VQASLRELNNNSSSLARAAQAGEVVVITDRGAPIVEMVAHREASGGVSRTASAAMFARLRNSLGKQPGWQRLRAELDAVVDPYVD
jgi:antitoxin (DNA-binding transcriptional repressor) of toxin-antitoxin stability system